MINNKDSQSISLNFGGDSHELDINTLLTSLLNFSAVIQDIQLKIAPDQKVDIKVRAPEKGSFLIDLLVSSPEAVNYAMSLFSRDNVSLSENLLSIFVNFLNLKDHLQGAPPKSIAQSQDGNDVLIENNNGQVIVMNNPVFHLYDTKVDQLLSKGFEAIQKDPAVESFGVNDARGNNKVKVMDSEFSNMATPIPLAPKSDKREITKEKVNVRAYKITFEEGAKWGFVYSGDKISAKITDPGFIAMIDNNEAFAKGDILVVDLQVSQVYDKSVGDYLNHGYEVIKIHEHLRPAKQQSMDFD